MGSEKKLEKIREVHMKPIQDSGQVSSPIRSKVSRCGSCLTVAPRKLTSARCPAAMCCPKARPRHGLGMDSLNRIEGCTGAWPRTKCADHLVLVGNGQQKKGSSDIRSEAEHVRWELSMAVLKKHDTS